MELGNGRASLVVTYRGTFSLSPRRNYISYIKWNRYCAFAFRIMLNLKPEISFSLREKTDHGLC